MATTISSCRRTPATRPSRFRWDSRAADGCRRACSYWGVRGTSRGYCAWPTRTSNTVSADVRRVSDRQTEQSLKVRLPEFVNVLGDEALDAVDQELGGGLRQHQRVQERVGLTNQAEAIHLTLCGDGDLVVKAADEGTRLFAAAAA